MLRYFAARILRAVFTVFGVVTAVFLIVRLIPGDPVTAILGDNASPEDQAALRASLHLDQPLPQQYGAFLSDVTDGTLGTSFRKSGVAVSQIVREVIPSTVALAVAGLLVAISLGILLGVLAAARKGSFVDHSARLVAVLALAIPTICLGPLLILVFGLWLAWLPLPGAFGTENFIGEINQLILPAFTIGTALSAIITRQTRGAMIETLSKPFVAAARARGLSEGRVLFVHGLRNAMMPVSTVAAAQLGALLSGTVITEKIFERDGLGTLFLDAFFARDIPVIQGTVLLVATTYVVVNLLLDVAYGLLDPRVRIR